MQVDLVVLGLAAKWPKLTKLQADRHDFRRRLGKASAEVDAARAHVPRARSADVDEAAAAVRLGRKPPEPKREADAKLALERAERERDILAGVCQRVEEEFGGFMAKHQGELFREVAEARDEIGRRAAKHAREALASYSAWSDLARVIKDLAPPPPSVETGPPGSDERGVVRTTNSFIGMFRAQTGPARGDIEAALSYLVSLVAEEADDDAAA